MPTANAPAFRAKVKQLIADIQATTGQADLTPFYGRARNLMERTVGEKSYMITQLTWLQTKMSVGVLNDGYFRGEHERKTSGLIGLLRTLDDALELEEEGHTVVAPATTATRARPSPTGPVFNGPVTGVQIGDSNQQSNQAVLTIGPNLEHLAALLRHAPLAAADRSDLQEAMERVRAAAAEPSSESRTSRLRRRVDEISGLLTSHTTLAGAVAPILNSIRVGLGL